MVSVGHTRCTQILVPITPPGIVSTIDTLQRLAGIVFLYNYLRNLRIYFAR